ncbi:hypothetical protein DLAC_07301 [Tieghemostelium lacteum]|uniref:EGF-like domain-containing protein n=1 Tax=Tieghemostelium lacteum TaxID=361077 RepID=A0A151ZC75_TIELA|nr:hypothetical protein DLAC_07301 [Tieghemostelium lacteum]|eukprot:KYQ91539.1 hypothetical protein DLAC_07301 [Tieghemostelium lacteum]
MVIEVTGGGYSCIATMVNTSAYFNCKTDSVNNISENIEIRTIIDGTDQFVLSLGSYVKPAVVGLSATLTTTVFPSVVELPTKSNYYICTYYSEYSGLFFTDSSGQTSESYNYIVGGSLGSFSQISTYSLTEIQTISSQIVIIRSYYPTPPNIYVVPTTFSVLNNYVNPTPSFGQVTGNTLTVSASKIMEAQTLGTNVYAAPLLINQNDFYGEYPNYYPFGLNSYSPSSTSMTMGFKSLVPQSYQVISKIFNVQYYDNAVTTQENPVLVDLKYDYISGREMVVTAVATDDVSGIKSIYLFSIDKSYFKLYELSSCDIINGTLTSGVFQKLITYNFENILGNLRVMVVDHYGRTSEYSYLNAKPLPQYIYDFSNIINFRYTGIYQMKSDIVSISFKSSTMDLSTSPKNNTMFIKFQSPKPDISVALYFKNEMNIYYRFFIGDWNEDIQQMEIEFYLPSRLLTGSVFYSISYPGYLLESPYLNHLYPTSKLNVYSQDCDRMPPLIISNETFNNGSYFGFDLTINDKTGFDKGFVSIKSDLDEFRFNFTLSSQGKNALNDVYRLELPSFTPCITQTFSLDIVELHDINEAVSSYSNGMSDGISPFLMIMDSISVLPVSCTQFADTVAPNLSYLYPSRNTVNTASEDRQVSITFSITDNSAIYYNHVPYCMANSEGLVFYTTPSKLVNYTTTIAFYQCDFDLPFGFGYPSDCGKILFLLYGFADTRLNIKSTGNTIPGLIFVTFNNNGPIITRTSKMTSLGGSLTIYGRNFGVNPQNAIVEVSYRDYTFNYTTSILYSVLTVIDNILEKQSEFNITLIINGQRSNMVIIQTVYVQPLPTSTPNPTSSGSKCPGTPECGGSSNGICVNAVCQCKSPWIGSDCLSQVIVVPNPTINTTDPAIDNNFNTTLPDGDTVTLKTLISIVFLNEMNINNTLIKEHPFTTWIFTNQTTVNQTLSQQYQYSTNITNNGLTTNITITLQYFTEETTLIFANQLLTILPSSIKYNIKLTPYQFSSELNYLQLIMSASIESTSTDSCTYQETGTTNDSNNDYVKLQIDNNSLYGRFIKRGVIDNRVRTIENIFFNNNESTNSNSNSRIGINIPYFRKSVELDPDFSVLLDITNANDKDNSICEQISDKGLSKSQLAGIIIGAVAFALIAIISLSYYFYKKRKHQQLLNEMDKKLKNFN